MIYWRLTGDDRAASAASRLIEFLAPHLHPDLTAAAEAGICRNAYVGQIGFLLHGSHPLAQAVVGRMATLADSAKRIRPYLDDDLRLCRWGILPVLAALLAGPPDIRGNAYRICAVLYAGLDRAQECRPCRLSSRRSSPLRALCRRRLSTRIYRGERLDPRGSRAAPSRRRQDFCRAGL